MFAPDEDDRPREAFLDRYWGRLTAWQKSWPLSRLFGLV